MYITLNIRLIVFLGVLAVLLLVALVGCRSGGAAPSGIGAGASAEMKSPRGEPMGTATLTQGPNGVLVSVDVTGLVPGTHGLHIHEAGSCSPDFSAAGDHFAVEGQEHGCMNAGAGGRVACGVIVRN